MEKTAQLTAGQIVAIAAAAVIGLAAGKPVADAVSSAIQTGDEETSLVRAGTTNPAFDPSSTTPAVASISTNLSNVWST